MTKVFKATNLKIAFKIANNLENHLCNRENLTTKKIRIKTAEYIS
jgi:hypothetical protein